jgi:hypothetical protein
VSTTTSPYLSSDSARSTSFALMPAVHSAHGIGVTRERQVLMRAPFLPEDSYSGSSLLKGLTPSI